MNKSTECNHGKLVLNKEKHFFINYSTTESLSGSVDKTKGSYI